MWTIAILPDDIYTYYIMSYIDIFYFFNYLYLRNTTL